MWFDVSLLMTFRDRGLWCLMTQSCLLGTGQQRPQQSCLLGVWSTYPLHTRATNVRPILMVNCVFESSRTTNGRHLWKASNMHPLSENIFL